MKGVIVPSSGAIRPLFAGEAPAPHTTRRAENEEISEPPAECRRYHF